MKPSLQILHIEDSLPDSLLVQHMLEDRGLQCDIRRVETREQLESALQEPQWDLILSDCTLPQFHGLEALKMAHAAKPDIPFIFISGTIGEETAINSLQNGATDYVLKQRLSRLIPAVLRAVTEAENRRERQAMEAHLRQTRKLETIGTLAGGLAHDFKNVLQILKMSIALLPLKADDPEQVKFLAEKLEKATDRGCGMIQELLDFARKTEANLQPVNVAAEIEQQAHLIRSALPTDINLSLHLEKNLPCILADAGQLDRIFTNLIMNARDAMPNGGQITVSTDLVRFNPAFAASWQIEDRPYFRVQISDNGMGMDEATQSRIFEPFFTTKPVGKGTGLGLSVVFGLMEAHRGYIDLHSRPGEGTTFSLFFSLAPGANVVTEKIQVVSPTQFLGKTLETDAGAVLA